MNANKYGLIEGSYAAEHLKVTADGLKAIDADIQPREQTKARAKLAIENIPPFAALYGRFVSNKLPARAALIDAAKEVGVPEGMHEECVDTFIVNLRFVGLLQTLSGAERIVTIDHLLDSLPSSQGSARRSFNESVRTSQPEREPHWSEGRSHAITTTEHAHFDTTCFYVTPIGEDGSEQRQHADLFLGSLIEPALEQFGLTVVRADMIDKPGTITRQIVEYLLRARLVIADLSFHNPNVFYELALRHAIRLPVVQLVRTADRIPFDLNQIRTVRIDTSGIHAFVPKIDTYRSEIASQVRRALEDPDAVDNPITTYYPGMKVHIDGAPPHS
ncbi:hypothetical protein [Achromobacter xylosoxidans]|uniref:hypothetical protein n=1 Tax=Alcaligenes xylosoxydans xylosoxydans TaxID=85698 RepID=UPI0038FD27F0